MPDLTTHLAARLPSPLRKLARAIRRLPSDAAFALIQPYLAARRRTRRAVTKHFEETRKPVVLFLAPEAGLTQFFVGHALLAKTLRESGHAPLLLSCAGALPHCSLKSATQDTSSRVCGQCRRAAQILGNKYELPDIALESLIGKTEDAEITAILARAGNEPWALIHDGIAFGEFAQGETLRARRKLDVTEFDAADHAELLATATSALRVYFAIRKLAGRFNIARIVYYGAYGHWLPAVSFARRQGIATTQIEHGYNRDIDLRLINLRPAPVHEQQMLQIERWADYRDIPIDAETVQGVAESGLFRLSNHGKRSTHSPNFVLRQHSIIEEMGLSPAKKTLVAYSSSADELSAARHIYRGLGLSYGNGERPFEDSNAWLAALVGWAGKQPDLQLIVRLHPRMATPTGQPLSVEEQGLRGLLTEVPENVRIIWPRDKASSYNLAEVADAALVSWSTIGLELARFGVPVVAAFPDRGSFPVGSFITFEPTAPRYFAEVRAAVGRQASMATIAEAMRWTHFLFLSPTVSFSECVPSHDHCGVPDWKMPADKDRITRALIGGEDASHQRMEQLRRDNRFAQAEQDAVRRAIEYYVVFFMTGRDQPGCRIDSLRALADGVVSLVFEGNTYRRYSPLAHRLAVLWNSGAVGAKPAVSAHV